MSGSNCWVLSCIHISQDSGKMFWYSHLFKNFPQFSDSHKGFRIVNEAEVGFFFFSFNSLAFSMIQWMLVIWSLVPLPFLSLACTSGSSWFILLKSSLKNFENYLAIKQNEHTCTVVWTLFVVAFLWDWNKNWPFIVLWLLLSFPNLLTYWVQHFNSSIF